MAKERMSLVNAALAVILLASSTTNAAEFEVSAKDVVNEIDACKKAPAKDCRNSAIREIKAYYDQEFEKNKDGNKTPAGIRFRKFLRIAVTTASLVIEGDRGKAHTQIGGDFADRILGDVFDIGLGDEAGDDRNAVWSDVQTKMGLEIGNYPLSQAIVDMQIYAKAAAP